MKVEDEDVRHFFDQTGLYLHKRYGIRLRRAIIKQLIPDKPYANVLDVGCGDGTLVLDFVEKADRIWMIDLSENMLHLAKKNIEFAFPNDSQKVNYHNGSFTSFEEKGQFDLILIVGVLAHVTDLGKVFEKLRSRLKPNGLLVVQYSSSDYLLIKIRRYWHRLKSNYALNRISNKFFLTLCEDNQFTIIARKKYNFPFFGMKYLSDNTLFKFQYWLMKQKRLSFLLSDLILVLKKSKDC